jgi:hypothetical protein
MGDISITEKSNYKKELSNTYKECVDSFQEIIKKYLTKIDTLVDKDISTLLIGLDAIQNIFSILLIKTKNLELVISNCDKIIYFFFEFISQIANTNKSQSILKLTANDAKFFIYKKTIYELLDVGNSFNDTEEVKFSSIKKYIIIYTDLITILLWSCKINIITNNIDTINEHKLFTDKEHELITKVVKHYEQVDETKKTDEIPDKIKKILDEILKSNMKLDKYVICE